MADKLWTDKDVREAFKTYGRNNAKKMRDDYERALAFRNEDIGRLQGELGHTKAQCLLIADSLKLVMLERDITQARLAELEAQMLLKWPGVWQPVTDADQPTEGVELIDPHADDDRRLYVEDDGATLVFSIEGGALEGTFMLPDGYAICKKAQPSINDQH